MFDGSPIALASLLALFTPVTNTSNCLVVCADLQIVSMVMCPVPLMRSTTEQSPKHTMAHCMTVRRKPCTQPNLCRIYCEASHADSMKVSLNSVMFMYILPFSWFGLYCTSMQYPTPEAHTRQSHDFTQSSHISKHIPTLAM